MSDHTPSRTAFEVAHRIARYAAKLDAAGHHAEADQADCAVRQVVIRLSANWMTNGWNAIQLGLHGGEPLYLLGTMRVQVTNLLDTVQRQRGYLAPAVQTLAERLVQNVMAWLERVQTDQFGAGGALDTIGSRPPAADIADPAPTPARQGRSPNTAPIRIAGAAGMIESNARAALGVMQYLDRQQLFPRGPEALRHITQALNALIALVDGSLPPEAVANQLTANEQARATSPTQEGRVPQQEQVEGVRQSLGNGGTTPAPASAYRSYDQYGQMAPVYNREAHIERYLEYMTQYGYGAMIAHLKQHEGDPAFIYDVKKRALSRQWADHQRLLGEVHSADQYQMSASVSGKGQGSADTLFNPEGTSRPGY
jgi:hypothetical protein